MEDKKGDIMKKNRVLIGVLLCLCCIVSTVCGSFQKAYADVESYPLLNFDISVPKGFDKDIRITADNGAFSDECIVSASGERYTGSVRVMGNSEYKITLEILGAKENEYSIDMQKTVEIGKNARWVGVVVSTNSSYDSEEKSMVDETTEMEDSELPSAESVYLTFIEKTKHIEGIENESYDYIFKYVGARERLFLDVEDENTSEEWESMTDYERFIYFFLVIHPRSSLLYNEEQKNVELFLKEEFEAIERFFENRDIPADDSVVVAIREVWEWLYHFYMENGYFCNLYRLEVDPNEVEVQESVVPEEKSDEVEKIEGNDEMEEENPSVEVGKVVTDNMEEEDDNEEQGKNGWGAVLSKLKSMWVSLALLLIVGVTLFVITMRNRKKNINEHGK